VRKRKIKRNSIYKRIKTSSAKPGEKGNAEKGNGVTQREKKSRGRQSVRKRKDRLLTTEENTIKDIGDNFEQ